MPSMISWVTCLIAFTFPSTEWETKQEVVIGVVEYAKVLVHEITDMACIDYPLDHVTPERIKELVEAVNQFILWNQCEIVLDDPTTTKNQLMSPLSQTTMPKDNEALLPMSSPPVPRFKEASLPSSPKEKEASTLPMSPVKVMPQQDIGHQEQDLPLSSQPVPKFKEASLL
jgi:hypothetical protein